MSVGAHAIFSSITLASIFLHTSLEEFCRAGLSQSYGLYLALIEDNELELVESTSTKRFGH
jgi:hypothetical protein